MRASSAAISIRPGKLNRAIEKQGSIVSEIDIERFKVCGGIDESNIACLNEVIRNDDVLLVGRDFDVVRTDGRLVFIRVIEALDVVQV